VNTITLIPTNDTIDYACFVADDQDSAVSGAVEWTDTTLALNEVLESVTRDTGPSTRSSGPPNLVVRIPYGGAALTQPQPASEALLQALEALVPEAPLHLPGCIELIRACLAVSETSQVIVVSETAFFADLSHEEASYAIDSSISKKLEARRYGYHGLNHRHACLEALAQCAPGSPDTLPKIISICLEPRPEVAAAIGLRPMMVSGGMTPLEGLCGFTACGDIDPSIVLELARTKGWGRDRITQCLGRESGLQGLTGRPLSWEQLCEDDGPETELARDIVQYQLLRHCGAAVSAMNGLDVVAFSGRGARPCSRLGIRLLAKLHAVTNTDPLLISSETPLHKIIHRDALRVLDDAQCRPAEETANA